jgi:hypothetical protein
MFLFRESKRKALEFLGMGDRRRELSFWFVVCVCVHKTSGAVIRVRVNGNSFGDRFKVKTLFTPSRFLFLAIRSVGGKTGWCKSNKTYLRNPCCIVKLKEWYTNRRGRPCVLLVTLWKTPTTTWFCFLCKISQSIFLYLSLLELKTTKNIPISTCIKLAHTWSI